MRKIIIIGLLAILIIICTLFVLGEDDYGSLGLTKEQINWLKELNNNLGIQVSGTGFNYDKSSNTLTLSSGTSATLTRDFSGTITLNGGTVELPNSAKFSGEGLYTQNSGFSITNGYLNGVEIANANGVAYNGNQISGTTNSDCASNCMVGGKEMSANTKFTYDLNKNELTGTASNDCSPCTFNGQHIGRNTNFAYDFNENQVTFNGKLGTTTLPNANIIFENGNYKLGDMIVDLKNSEIYLAKGDRMTFDGIGLTAEKGPVKLSFIESAEGSKLIPIKKELFQVSQSARSISDVFKEAGYGSNNFQARKELYEKTFPGETYKSVNNANQNIKLLNALKSGEAVLFYNDQASNVQIRFPNVKWDPALPSNAQLNTDTAPLIKGKLFSADTDYDPEMAVGLDRRKGYYITPKDIPIAKANLNNNPEFFNILKQKSAEFGLDQTFVSALCGTESNCDPTTKCYGFSCGPMQMTLDAVNELNRRAELINKRLGYKSEKDDWIWIDEDEPTNSVKDSPYLNAEAGIKYLSYLNKDYNGNIPLIAAAYNAGPTIVNKMGSVPKYRITPIFVNRVLTYYNKWNKY